MAEIVNFNKVRKTKIKQGQAAKAVENRVIYGLSTKVRKAHKRKHMSEGDKLDQNVLDVSPDNKKS
jgi:hypothetical protein